MVLIIENREIGIFIAIFVTSTKGFFFFNKIFKSSKGNMNHPHKYYRFIFLTDVLNDLLMTVYAVTVVLVSKCY